MPIYEFACRECDRPFEELVKMNGSAVTASCPHCGSEDTQRRLSVFSVGAPRSGGNEVAAAPSGGGCCGGSCGCR